MHEYSIVQSLIGQVERLAADHGAHAVHRLHLRIGELSGVEVDLLRTAFETFRQRTICADASLEIEHVPLRWVCPVCGETVPQGAVLRCAVCERPARLDQGDEIVLERLEMEIPDTDAETSAADEVPDKVPEMEVA